ncbi:MAG: hypothetical protein NTZ09_11080 [Candidatus Hydrogenedentes bacterium]|nr:hypothetical protein [Candidatus Hydrogenedentota bacterium]
MKRRSHARRNVFLVIVIFALAALAVTATRLFPRNAIPPESAEMAARRADRENNGWYLLEQILAETPDPPQAAWGPLPDDPSTVGYYRAEPGSLGSRIGVGRPDDDPILVEYLASGSKLVPRVREVLAKPFILLPPEASDPESKFFSHPGIGRDPYFDKVRSLLPLLFTHAFILSGQTGSSAESVGVVRDSFELVARMHEASLLDYAYVHTSTVFDTLPRLLPEHQRQLLDWAVLIQARQRPSREKIEFDLRQHKIFLDSLKKEGSILHPLEAATYLRYRTLFMRHFDYAFKTAYMYPNEFEQLAGQDPIVLKFEAGYYFGFSLASNVRFNASWNRLMNGSILILAIELYRHGRGEFPASLQELVPGYVATLPDDVYADRGVTYLYERGTGGYRLLNHSDSNDKTVFARKLEPLEKSK